MSFVGTNDAGKLHNKNGNDGAILTVFREKEYDEVHLLYNNPKQQKSMFQEIAEYVKNEIRARGFCLNVFVHNLPIRNVTDHNEIYPTLLSFCRSLTVDKTTHYTAAIASGTPTMQVCWILIAESGDFPLTLIRSNEPKFGKPYVIPVKLGIGLPKIIRLEEENKTLRKQNEALIPTAKLNIKRGSITIGDKLINLSPIEFSYYRYFAELVKNGSEPLNIIANTISSEFVKTILDYHEQSFKVLDSNRMFKDIGLQTFRGNVSKTNKAITNALNNPSLATLFHISVDGNRGAKHYSIKLPSNKITIR